MSSTELSVVIKTLKNLQLVPNDENNPVPLGDLFEHCIKLQKLIEMSDLSSTDEIYQNAVTVCIQLLEKCTTMVNDLELFSSNETIDEIQTSSVKYLTLPALLGSLNLNLQAKDLSRRMEHVKIAEVYFRDFLLRCKNYELCEKTMKYFDAESDEEKSSQDPNSIRQRKIEQFKLKKELEVKEKNLQVSLERPESEEYVREYYMAFLEKWILIAIEEIENLKREKAILKSIPKTENASSNIKKAVDIKPLKPIILTRNEIEKRVFGLGYPSVPVMTIDDFYYQRFHNQIKNKKAAPSGMSLQEKALRGEDLSQETEDTEKEELLEKDDPVALLKARQWDDWKDDNRRGSGNRKNKG